MLRISERKEGMEVLMKKELGLESGDNEGSR